MTTYKKNTLLVIRWIVGLLFIFSGLIKANDPLGLSYKMQEFFEAWNWHSFNDYTLILSLVMNVFEVLAGVAIIIGWRTKLFTWLLLLLIIFFAFLTGYALFSGKIKTCGCFGDCLPLTPAQSFTKDLILFVLILILFINKKQITSSVKSAVAITFLALCIVFVSFLQGYVMRHLPLLDCLPYKKGNNILKEMKPPPNAVPDSVVMVFKYRKNGKIIEYSMNDLPADLDSSYEFIDRSDKIIRKGNATPAITDFALFALNGNDTTSAILNSTKYSVMLFAKDFENFPAWNNADFRKLQSQLQQKQIPLFIITADKQNGETLFGNKQNVTVLLCDGTVIKTAARVNPTYFVMKGADIISKFSYVDLNKNISSIKNIGNP
ncbi:MAG TPA: BT_3928 family protein [Parafilimonas sp.]|nr:BT_3928 family protein [Parafilimonas sp.]